VYDEDSADQSTPVVDLERSLRVDLQANGVKFTFQSLQSTAPHEVSQHLLHVVDPLLG